MKDGGPAFPCEDGFGSSNGMLDASYGLSKRDYFAAKAMQALVQTGDVYGDATRANVPTLAYWIADAMLKAREQ